VSRHAGYRATLVRQFLGEAVLIVIVAGLTGLILAESDCRWSMPPVACR